MHGAEFPLLFFLRNGYMIMIPWKFSVWAKNEMRHDGMNLGIFSFMDYDLITFAV